VRNIFYIIGITIVALFCSSCKRKDTNNFPIISIEQPSSTVACAVECQFIVSGEVESVFGIEYVKAGVFTKDGTPVSTEQKLTFNKQQKVTFSFTITVSDIYLVDGLYSLKVSAYNGELVKNEFRDIYITTPALTVENIYLASENSGNVSIYKYNALGNTLEHTFASDFGTLVCDSRTKTLVVGGRFKDIVWFNEDFDVLATVPSRNTTFPYFHHYTVDNFTSDFALHVSNEEGFITKHSSSGGLLGSYPTENGGNDTFLPYFFQNLSNSYTVVDMQNVSGTIEALHLYFTSTGFLINTAPFVDKELVGVGDLGSKSKTILLFLNEAGVGKVYSYNMDTNLMVELKNIGSEIYNVAQRSTTDYILATNTGLLRYSNVNGSSTQFNAAICPKVYFNKLDKRILAISGTNLYWFDDFGNIAQTSINPEPISGMAIMFSK
jgi:hypothetical protein